MAKNVVFHTNQTSEDLSYLAGIIDGEGCFYIGKTKQGKYGSGYQWHAFLKITSCDEILIIWLEKTFGGAREERYRWTSKKAFARPVFSWQASGMMLDYLIPLIYSRLVIKKRHCAIMGQYRNTCDNIGSKRLSDHVVELRTNFMTELRQLNSRFHNHPLKNPSPLSP